MKKLFLVTALLMSAGALFSQKASTTWSDEFKMKKGSTDLSVAFADETGVYVKEGHMALKSYFVISATMRGSATLVKLDKTFQEEYRNDFNKELKGKGFEDFFFIGKKAWILASSYNKKQKTLELYAAEIDKSNGQLKGEWKDLSSIQKEEKND